MDIQKVSVSQINPAPYNPRQDLQPGDQEYEKLRQSMATFGCVELLVWNKRTGTLVSGHQRFKILKAEGLQEIEVSVVDLPLAQEKALNLALNKIRGNWDQDKLADILRELNQTPDINVGLTGFDLPEISQILDGMGDEEGEDGFDVEADVEANTNPITQPGDLVELGRHRIFCADARLIPELDRLLKDYQADILFTDPPYNVRYSNQNRPRSSQGASSGRSWSKIQADDLSQGDYETFLEDVLGNASKHLKKGAPFYLWNGHRQFGPMEEILIRLGFHVADVITWAKPTFAPSYSDHNQQTEFCLYGWKKGAKHQWYGPNNESNLWKIDRDNTQSYIHPTQKALGLARRALRNSSKRGDIVLDLFLGSGSTLIASEGMERITYGLEIDPRYCDAIVRRYMAYAGEDKVSLEIRNKYSKETVRP